MNQKGVCSASPGDMCDELSLDTSQKEDQLAAGILAVLSPAVELVDGKIGDVR